MTLRTPFDPPFLASEGTVAGRPSGDRVLTDSREDVRGALFVALAGDRFDGHDFVADALARGAGGAVVSRAWRDAHPASAGDLLVVDDTLRALQRLAARHRARHPVPLVAITGSNGKTTVKELVAAALSGLGPVLRTEGNRNNHIGLPLTLLSLRDEHVAAVCEMGMNHPGELTLLATLARPRVAVITNVSAAHLAGVGDRAGVARAKVEIAAGLDADGLLVVPAGDPDLETALSGYAGRRRTFGLDERADVHPRRVETLSDGRRRIVWPDGTIIDAPSPGEHMARNVVAALAAAEALGVGPAAAGIGLARARTVGGRMELKRAGDALVFDDSYNANPGSLAAAVAVLREHAGAARRIAVLGDMLELGDEAAALHRASGGDLAFLDRLITVGGLARAIGNGAVEAGLPADRWTHVATGAEAAALLVPELRAGDVVLVKGSRGMRLETVVRALVDRREGTD